MKYYMMRVDEETHDRVAEMAKKDDRSLPKELSRLVKFAYENIDNKTFQVINAMTPQKGMTEEEVRQTPKYKELEEQLTALKQEAYEIEGGSFETMEDVERMRRLSDENKSKQDEIQDQMRAMLNV